MGQKRLTGDFAPVTVISENRKDDRKRNMIKHVLFDLDGTLLPMDQNEFVKYYMPLLAKRFVKYGMEPKALIGTIWKGVEAMVLNDGSTTNEDAFWKCFEKIFNEYNFDGWNAIDIMLIVSNEINNRFFNVTPSVTMALAKTFQDLYKTHMNQRADFIYEKIKINIEKGMEQGMYKNDVSSEMIARMFIAKLNDIHNPEIYPPEGFTFTTIFNNLIDNVIKSITNDEGKRYYKQRKQLYSVLNFR